MNLESKKSKIEFLDERSHQVREILGKTPNWMIRWGTVLIFVIVILLLIGTFLIRYDEIVKARIVISTEVPPAYIETRSSGKITSLFVGTGQSVGKGEVLAEIENNASLEDISLLKERIEHFDSKLISIDSISVLFPSNLKLGRVRNYYSDFVISYQNFILYQTLQPNKSKINSTSAQIAELFSRLEKQKRQVFLFEQGLKLAESNYDRNIKLREKGVISKSEFESEQRKILTERQKFEDLKASMSVTKLTIASSKGNKQQSAISDQEFSYSYRQDLVEKLEVLKNEISDWEFQFIVKSPMNGKITMFDKRNLYQNVKEGEVLFTVVPDKMNPLVGQVTMPIRNSGRVKLGQKVKIKVDNYPFEEWGSIQGMITDISSVPKRGEAMYSIQVRIDSLRTSYNQVLEFKQEMQGDAEIITEELSVFQRIFYQLKSIFSR